MDYHKNAPWTAVSRGRLASMAMEDGASLEWAEARLRLLT